MRKPNFENLLKVLNLEVPDRPTLFELFLNPELNRQLTGTMPHDEMSGRQNHVDAFVAAGYDYSTMSVPGFCFRRSERKREQSVSINDGALIFNDADFDAYVWPEFKREQFDLLKQLHVPSGMKLVLFTPDGLMENSIALMGYDNLCLNLYDNPDLVRRVVDKVGETLLAYYDWALDYDCVGAAICNDDWGFNSMPLLPPETMRELIIPWNCRFIELIHSKGRPAIQHACGNIYDCGLMEDVIEICKFDAHHSFEDKILPIEEAYPRYHHRIALLGGVDVDFLCRSTPEKITERCNALLDMSEKSGAYALGSGNSIPDYVPSENYFAMTRAALNR